MLPACLKLSIHIPGSGNLHLISRRDSSWTNQSILYFPLIALILACPGLHLTFVWSLQDFPFFHGVLSMSIPQQSFY